MYKYSSEKFRIQTNGEVYTLGTGKAGGDFRAPIFYDSNNTAYYADPASTSVFNALTVGGSNVLTEADPAIVRRRGTITSQDWNTYIDGTEAGWYQVNNASGSNRPSAYTYGTQLNFSTSSANKLQIYAPHNATDGNGVWIRTGWNTDYDAWREIPLYGMAPYSGGDLRASVFYDSNNTGYYIDPASTSIVNSITANDTLEAYHIGVRNTSSGTKDGISLYGGASGAEPTYGIMFTGTSGSGTHGDVTGDWATYFTMNNDTSRGWIFRRVGSGNSASISAGGVGTFDSAVKSPTFYDSNNTAYYTDPAGTSNLYDLTVNQQISGSIDGASNSVAITGYGNGNFTFHQTSSSFNVFSGWHNYFIGNHGNGSNYYNTIIAMPFWGSPRYSRLEGGTQRGPYEFWTSEIAINSSQNITAPIYYDYNDTGYYVNPASQSILSTARFSGVVANGSPTGDATIGRNHAYDTMELKGYGQEMMIGSQGAALHINYRTCNNGVSGHTPTSWYWRAGSSTSYSDHYMGLIQSSSSMRAPIFYDSDNTNYYLNPASTSSLNLLTVNGVNSPLQVNGASGNDAVLILKDGNTFNYIGSEIQFQSNSGSTGARIEYLSNPGASEMRIYTEGSSTNSARFKTQATYFNNQVHATQFVGQTYVITGSVDHTYQNSYAYWYYNWHQSTSFSSTRYAENSFVAPFDGYIGKFYHRGVGLDSSSATALSVIAEINGAYNNMGNGTLSGSGSNKIFTWTNTSSTTLDFNEGDRIEMKWNINALFGESCYAVELVRKPT